jgi:hypothetical protein
VFAELYTEVPRTSNRDDRCSTIGDVPTERILALAGLVLSLFLLARFGPAGWKAWQIYAGVRQRRLADAGPLEIPAPPGVRERLDELEALGVDRIGERFLRLPGTPIRYEWVVGEPSGETYIVVVPITTTGTSIVACYSSFEDSTWVQTNFPRGAVVDRPAFQASFVTTSLTEALAAHRAQVARMRSRHGPPREIRTMADTLRMDADFRTHHGGLTLRPLTMKLLTPAIASGLLALISALLLLAR